MGSISALSAADYHPHSPTQQYQANFSRIEEKIRINKESHDSILGQLALLDYSDQRDLTKPESLQLKALKAQKQINRNKCDLELKKLKRELKKLAKEKKQLESTQF
jgi:hypothetical protein